MDAMAARTKNQRLQRQYRAAIAEYHRITRYLKSGVGILSQAERDLLSEYAELAKRKYEFAATVFPKRGATGPTLPVLSIEVL
jgi:hypothetical protein